MINTQVLKGNLIRQDYTTAFVLNQGDKGVPFKIELLENGTPYTLLSDDIVTIEWLKPNGNPFLQEGNIKYGTNYIEFTTPEAVAQYAGNGSFNVIISNNDVRKGTIMREYKVVTTSMKPGSVSEDVITDAITELRNLNTELAETVQNNQEIINSNSAATKTDIANVNSSLEEKANDNEVRKKDKNITLNDCDSEMLTAIQGGEGTSFELLSVPRDNSVSFEKFDSSAKNTLFITDGYDDTSATKKGDVNSTGVFLVNKNFDNCLISNVTIQFTQPATGEIKLYENNNGILTLVKTIEYDTTALGGLNPTIEINYKADNAYIGITKTSGTVDFGEFLTYGLLTYDDKTQTSFNLSDCNSFDNYSLPFKIEYLIINNSRVESDIKSINDKVSSLNSYLTTDIDISNSDILKYSGLYIVNGEETTGSTEWYTSEYIDISLGATITGYGIKTIDAIAFYDENKTFVKSIKPTEATSNANIFKATITVEEGLYKYCRVVSVVYSDSNKFVGNINTSTNGIEYLKNKVAKLESNSGIVTNIITVGKSGCDFTEIQDAINSISDDSENNRYLILVYPGKYKYFHTWVYGIKPVKTQRYISIIGLSKYDCIVDDAFSSTFTSNGILKNMTLISNKKEIDTTGLELMKDYDTEFGYALHIDMNQNNAGMKINIEDCDLISFKGATVGMGTWNNDNITFKNCNIIREENISTKVSHDASKMAFYCHNAQWSAPLQNLHLINNKIYTAYDVALYLHDTMPSAETPSYLYVDAINNNISSKNNGFNCIQGKTLTDSNAISGQGIFITDNSFGNTNEKLNKTIGNTINYV